jgi:plasmid stabilization system protein ParE
MAYVVHITDKALVEIDEAMGWYAKRSVPAAIRWYLRLKQAIGSLEDNPDQNARAPESDWCDREIRQMLHGKKRGIYRILFEIRGDIVYVLRVRHGARNFLGADDL